MKKLNKTGPSTDPWGTLLATGLQPGSVPPTTFQQRERIRFVHCPQSGAMKLHGQDARLQRTTARRVTMRVLSEL